jgi:hypothetical protein
MPKHHGTLHASGIYLEDSPGASRVITTDDGVILSFNNDEIANSFAAESTVTTNTTLTTEDIVIVNADGKTITLPLANTRIGETISVMTILNYVTTVQTQGTDFLHIGSETSISFGGSRILHNFRSNGVNGWYDLSTNLQRQVSVGTGTSFLTGEDFVIVQADSATVNLPRAVNRPGEFISLVNADNYTTTVSTQGLDFVDVPAKSSTTFSGIRAMATYRSNGSTGWYNIRGQDLAQVVITTNYTITNASFVLVQATGKIVTLPLAATRRNAIISIVIDGSHTVTIQTAGTDFINIPPTTTHIFSGDRSRRHFRSNGSSGWYFMDNT